MASVMASASRLDAALCSMQQGPVMSFQTQCRNFFMQACMHSAQSKLPHPCHKSLYMYPQAGLYRSMSRSSNRSGSWFLKPQTLIVVMLVLMAMTQQSSAQLATQDDPFNENIQVCASLDTTFNRGSTRQDSMSSEGGSRLFRQQHSGHYAYMNQPQR